MLAVCGGVLDLPNDYKSLMMIHNVDSELQNEILGNLKQPINMTCYKYILTYLLHKLVHHKNLIDECFTQLERRMNKEYKQKIITKEMYFGMRRLNFDIIKIVEFLSYNDYSITIFQERSFIIGKSL
jgi:hypothetical protein